MQQPTKTATCKSEARKNLALVIAALQRAGFSTFVDSRDPAKRRPGFAARFLNDRGVARGVWIFDHYRSNEFGKVCAALEAAGFTLTDRNNGRDFVKCGCARVLNT